MRSSWFNLNEPDISPNLVEKIKNRRISVANKFLYGQADGERYQHSIWLAGS